MSDAALKRFERSFGPEFGHGKTFDLTRLSTVLNVLGSPHASLPPVFHVAGTNGKGSTIAFMRAIAEAAGLRVHAFTKPHLFALRERFVVAGEIVSDEALIKAAGRVAGVNPKISQFDAQVAAALTLFSETPADLVLLETGMGGRDDSTNVIAPALSIITPISLDHQDALGPTLTDIAAHKAGILKRNAPAISVRQPLQVMASIEAEAERVGAALWRQGVDWDAYSSNGRLVVQTEKRALDLPLPNLAGPHQIDNAGLAAAALLAPVVFTLDDDAFARGIRSAQWPGRLQRLSTDASMAPIIAAGGEVWVDGGHNAHAAQALSRTLGELKRKREAPVVAIIGMRARKDAEAFVGALAGAVDYIIAVPLPEAHIAPELIASYANATGVEASVAPSLAAAMKNAARYPAPRVLICGSLLLVAEALRA